MTSADDHPRLRIDVWADVVCPACYVADHRLREAIADGGHEDRIDLVLHAFELHPDTPDEVLDNSTVLAGLMGASIDQVEAMEERFAALARADGLPFEIRRKHRNTRTIHRVLRLAAEHGVASDLMVTLQAAVFGGDARAFDHEYLVEKSVALGLSGGAGAGGDRGRRLRARGGRRSGRRAGAGRPRGPLHGVRRTVRGARGRERRGLPGGHRTGSGRRGQGVSAADRPAGPLPIGPLPILGAGVSCAAGGACWTEPAAAATPIVDGSIGPVGSPHGEGTSR